jgi:predicted ATP-dependent protease
MLRKDVVEAVEEGNFHVYPVETVDEGIEILTGVPAGERDEEGNYPEGTINYKVEQRLAELAEKRAKFAKSAEGEE